MSRMIGTARQPTLSSWCTIEVKRKRRGCTSTRSSATTSAPSMLTNGAERMPDRDDILADRGERVGEFAAAVLRHLLALDAVHLVHQRAVVLLQPGDLRVAAARGKAARQPLQQPGAEGIELVDARHVDIDAFDGAAPAGGRVDLAFQPARVAGGPGAGAGELELVAFGTGFEQAVAHPGKPLILLPSPAALGAGANAILDPRR